VADGLSRNPLVDITDGFSSTEIVCPFVSKFNLPTGLERNELRFQQKVDPQLGPIFSLQCKTKDRFSKHFCTQNDVLYRKTKNEFAMCIPYTLRNTVLYFCHDVPAAGHMGAEKTLERVRQRYWWRQISVDVRKYVLFCLYCQLHKHQTGKPFGLLQPIPPPSSCFESVVIDHLGPFKETTRGNQLSPGTAFTAKFTADAMKGWSIRHVFATGEHPQTSGLVERVNRTLALAIAAYVNTDHNDWDTHLKEVAFAINTSVQITTEKMPFEVVFARKPRTPLDNALSWPVDRPQSFEEFQSRVDDLRKEVYIRIIEKQSKVKALADCVVES
jgi:hypothetical protein